MNAKESQKAIFTAANYNKISQRFKFVYIAFAVKFQTIRTTLSFEYFLSRHFVV